MMLAAGGNSPPHAMPPRAQRLYLLPRPLGDLVHIICGNVCRHQIHIRGTTFVPLEPLFSAPRLRHYQLMT